MTETVKVSGLGQALHVSRPLNHACCRHVKDCPSLSGFLPCRSAHKSLLLISSSLLPFGFCLHLVPAIVCSAPCCAFGPLHLFLLCPSCPLNPAAFTLLPLQSRLRELCLALNIVCISGGLSKKIMLLNQYLTRES